MGDIVSQSHAQELPSITCLGFDRARKPGAPKGWATLHLPREKAETLRPWLLRVRRC